jgi:NAD(P)-dependent dehydrogenase (short-subunit alcohol dehydrogenase family)
MFGAEWDQIYPPKPTFTEKDVPPGSQVGKVFMVTGANQGIGYELVKLLYHTGATIYLAGRSEERVKTAIKQIQEAHKPPPLTPSVLRYLPLDLNDLTTIKASAAEFAAQEKKLDILWNNAGIGGTPIGVSTKQNIEGHVGVNCVATLMFTQELLPQLQEAAKIAPVGSVRIIWTASLAVESLCPAGGVDFQSIESGACTNPNRDYGVSKAGTWYLAVEAAKRWGKFNIISVVQNPGSVKTNIYSNQPRWLMAFVNLALSEPGLAGYTCLFSGFSSDIGLENNGTYIRPFGRVAPNGRQDIYASIAAGEPTKFWEWCEKKYEPYG